MRSGIPGTVADPCRSARTWWGVMGADYSGVVSEARQELIELVEALPEDQVGAVLADLRRRGQVPPPRSGSWPPAWFGAIDRDDLPSDLARNHDRYLAESSFGAFRG